MDNNKGFSLVEIMIVIFILSLILSALFLTLSTAKNTWENSETYIELNQELRKVKESLLTDIRQADALTIDFSADDQIDFKIFVNVDINTTEPQSANISYIRDNNDQLTRYEDEENRTVANNITALTINDDDFPLHRVSITAGKQSLNKRALTKILNFEFSARN